MSNENKTPSSEQEDSSLMYQSMADYMNEQGMDVSAEDIQKTVDEQFSENPPEPSEQDEEIINAMAEYQKEYLRQNPIYSVRGALLYCNAGSHCRRLNLPRSHGVYILNHAAMHAGDNVGGMEGSNINITTFGICSLREGGESITLKKEAPRNSDGTYTGDPSDGVVRGCPCLPTITDLWQDTHADTKIGAEQLPALTTLSFLMCTHGGIIRIWRSGQEDAD